MNYISKIFEEIIKMDVSKDAMQMATKVRTGKMKISELNILARGGAGISIRTKRVAKKAKKILDRR